MKNVGIICGGFSSEYEISVKSARNIQDNFPSGYNAELVFLRKDGWFVETSAGEVEMNISDLSYEVDGNKHKIDVAIVYIHGDPGENGKVQAYLEMINVPYVNSGPLASQLSFDKWYCNQFLKGFGYHVADSIYLSNESNLPSTESVVQRLGLPIFVKPCDSGSSFGIARVNRSEELIPSIQDAFKEGRTVVLESFLEGKELTCGVYRSVEGVQALPLTEIVTDNDFFDYEAKYQGLSDEITPARIDDEITEKVQEVSRQIYNLLNLRSIARIDFMLVNDVPHVIEVNTTPGFSNESIVPKMIKVSGDTTQSFWGKILKAELDQ
jgi:D-alanine-D-alanine ligase